PVHLLEMHEVVAGSILLGGPVAGHGAKGAACRGPDRDAGRPGQHAADGGARRAAGQRRTPGAQDVVLLQHAHGIPLRGRHTADAKVGRVHSACRSYSATVAVGVAGHRPLDVVPAVAHGLAGLAPGQARTRTAGVPVALELRFDVLEALAAILAIGVVAVLVGRLVV